MHISNTVQLAGLILLISIGLKAQTTLQISGGHLKATGTTVISLADTNWENAGNFTAANSTVRFTGGSTSSIGGSQTTDFYNVEVDKTAAHVELAHGISIENELEFTNGYFDLSGFDTTLGMATGTLVNEREDSRVIGATGGELIKQLNLNAPVGTNPGMLGVLITSSANLGLTEIRRGHQSQVLPGSGQSIDRYYTLSPANNTGLDASLRLLYFNAELNGLDVATVEPWRGNATNDWSNYPITDRDNNAPWVEVSQVDTLGRWTLGTPSLKLAARVFLQGPFGSNTMSDNLRSSGLIPLEEPYTSLGYSQLGGGGEKTTTTTLADSGNDAIVDWLLLELRDETNPSTLIATQAVLLQADGDIVDVDGTSAVRWSGIIAGNYYLVVRHRNHLDVRSATTLGLGLNTASYDFTTASSTANGTNALVDLGSGTFGLWAGDVNGDGAVYDNLVPSDAQEVSAGVLNHPDNTGFFGSGPVSNFSGFDAVYDRLDVNMDGKVFDNLVPSDRQLISNIILIHPANTGFFGSGPVSNFSGLVDQINP